MKTYIILLTLLLTACHNDFTPEEIVRARQYCKSNEMEYFVQTIAWRDAKGLQHETTTPSCKDIDGHIYKIPIERVQP